MTASDNAKPHAEELSQDRRFLGHPKGLGFLTFIEAGERFSYYDMQSLRTVSKRNRGRSLLSGVF